MKIIVVGVGSIGIRHLKNLIELGHEIYAVDINEHNLNNISSMVKGVFDSLDKALEIKPDIAFICTYSNNHINTAIKCAAAGTHLFIEKPLALDMTGIDELSGLIRKKSLVTMVGCNMRFHPAISSISQIINSDASFSKKLWADVEFGFYLPFAKKNYESHYMANKNMGGNLIFDAIHELDYAVWFFGLPEQVICTKAILSELKIDTEDCVDMIIKFASGTVCKVHLDYLQHGYSRKCKIVCERGTIVWDFTFGKIGTINTDGKGWLWKEVKADIYYNEMYIDEIKYFLDCVLDNQETFNSVEQSIPVLKLAIAANTSAFSNKWEKI